MYTIKTVDVLGSSMEVFMFEAEGEGPHPGIVLAQHIPVGHTGVENDTFTLKTAERLAENGYTVSVPFIFHWWPKEDEMQVKRDESRDDWQAADMQAGYDVLDGMASVDSQRIGIVGHCWGGRVAWIGACHNPNYKAAAVFYGGRIGLVMGDGDTPPIDLAGNIKCPVIGFFGNDDQNPSPEDVDAYDAALTAGGVPHTFHRYDSAGHAFQAFTMEERYRPEASEDAWGKLLVFLKEHLMN